MTALISATTQALEAAVDMQAALLAAARLLKDCTCQNQREAESLEALRLADNALSRWQGATRVMINLARADQQRRADNAQRTV